MDFANTTWFLACILLITPFIGAQLAPGDNPALAMTGGSPGTTEDPGSCPIQSAGTEAP